MNLEKKKEEYKAELEKVKALLYEYNGAIKAIDQLIKEEKESKTKK